MGDKVFLRVGPRQKRHPGAFPVGIQKPRPRSAASSRAGAGVRNLRARSNLNPPPPPAELRVSAGQVGLSAAFASFPARASWSLGAPCSSADPGPRASVGLKAPRPVVRNASGSCAAAGCPRRDCSATLRAFLQSPRRWSSDGRPRRGALPRTRPPCPIPSPFCRYTSRSTAAAAARWLLPDFCLFPRNREGNREGVAPPLGSAAPHHNAPDQSPGLLTRSTTGKVWSIGVLGLAPEPPTPIPLRSPGPGDRPGPPESRARGGGLRSCKELSGRSGPDRARHEPWRPRTLEFASLRPRGASRPPAAARRTPRGRRGGAGQLPRQEARLAPSSRACLLPSAPSRLLSALPSPPTPLLPPPPAPQVSRARERQEGRRAAEQAAQRARPPPARRSSPRPLQSPPPPPPPGWPGRARCAARPGGPRRS